MTLDQILSRAHQPAAALPAAKPAHPVAILLNRSDPSVTQLLRHLPATAAAQASQTATYASPIGLGSHRHPFPQSSTAAALHSAYETATVDRSIHPWAQSLGSSPSCGQCRRPMGCGASSPAHPHLRRRWHHRCSLFCLPPHSASDAQVPGQAARPAGPVPSRGFATLRIPATLLDAAGRCADSRGRSASPACSRSVARLAHRTSANRAA